MKPDDPRVKALAVVAMAMFGDSDDRKNALVMILTEEVTRTPDSGSWDSLVRELGKNERVNQLRILKCVKACGATGATLDKILEGFDGSTRQGVGGMLSGITKLCRRFGLNPERVIASRNDRYFSGEFLMNENGI